ncbi:MAG: AI-2E family transporter [Candidatus Pacearchaeota archaeon]
MEKKELNKILFLGFSLILLFYSYLIIKDFIAATLSSFVLAYILLPLHKKLSGKINPNVSSLICILLSAAILSIVIFFIGQTVYSQINNLIEEKTLEEIFEKINWKAKSYNISLDITSTIENYAEQAIVFLSKILFALIKEFINIILIFLFSYFILVYWEKIEKEFYEILPFENKEEIFYKTKEIFDSITKTSLIIAVIESVFSFIFFSLLGFKYSLSLSVIIFFLAFVPILGPAVVWLPSFVYNLLLGNYLFSFLILIYGIIISYPIDSFLRNAIASKKSKINPIIMFLGVLGGIKLFGIFGILIGPLILYSTISIITHKKN